MSPASPPATTREVGGRPSPSPAGGRPAREGWHLPQVLIYAGLFLASSDRLLAVNFGSLTLKPSYVFFSAALWFVLTRNVLRPIRVVGTPIPGFGVAVILLLAVNVVAGCFGVSAKLTIQQLVTIFGGAVVPFLCVAFGLTSRVQLERGISAWILGTLAAATFGFYQFAAPYLGLPQGLEYSGLAAGLGRISAWSYEPAFYAYHLELALAIVVKDVLTRHRRFGVMPELVALFLIANLILTNARAAYLSFPILVILVMRAVAGRQRLDRRAFRVIRLVVASAAVILVLGVPLGINLPKYVVTRVQSVTNTQEIESNALRLELYDVEVELLRQRPWLGYGPGNIGLYLADRLPMFRGIDPHAIVANNLILQTALDAGIVSIPIVMAVIWTLYRASRRSPSVDARVLLAGVSAILFVNSMLVSLFWDMRLWVVIGLAYAAARVAIRTPPDVPPTRGAALRPG